MKLKDIRLLSKSQRREIVENSSAEYAYILAEKTGLPIYRTKRGAKVKYFIGYFNTVQDEIKIADAAKIVMTNKLDSYELVDKNELENSINPDVYKKLKELLSENYKKQFVKKYNDFKIVFFKNDIYTTDIPFRRDVVVIYSDEKVIGVCYISGLLFSKNDVYKFSDILIDQIVESNSDCRRLVKKGGDKKEILINYLSDFYEHSFIDSIFISNDFRGLGLASFVYVELFKHFNKGDIINLTSCVREIQTKEAKGLWDKIKNNYPDNYCEDDDFLYLRFINN